MTFYLQYDSHSFEIEYFRKKPNFHCFMSIVYQQISTLWQKSNFFIQSDYLKGFLKLNFRISARCFPYIRAGWRRFPPEGRKEGILLPILYIKATKLRLWSCFITDDRTFHPVLDHQANQGSSGQSKCTVCSLVPCCHSLPSGICSQKQSSFPLLTTLSPILGCIINPSFSTMQVSLALWKVLVECNTSIKWEKQIH